MDDGMRCYAVIPYGVEMHSKRSLAERDNRDSLATDGQLTGDLSAVRCAAAAMFQHTHTHKTSDYFQLVQLDPDLNKLQYPDYSI